MTTDIKLLNDDMLKKLFHRGNSDPSVIIVDIREPSEYAREHIPNSRNIPLATLGKTDFSSEHNKTAVFYCRLGSRTRSAQKALLATGFKKMYCIEGGIEQWKNCGLPTAINRKAPLDIMRQVQITAGLAIN